MNETRTMKVVKTDWIARAVFALLTAASVATIAYICAWFEYRGFHYYRLSQIDTRSDLDILRQEIDQHRRDSGKLPTTLEAVKKASHGDRLMDQWGRPLNYEVSDDSYQLYSYGQDGQPGGSGLDADLYASTPPSANELLTLSQFSSAPGVRGIMLACLLAGFIALPIYFLCSKNPGQDRRSLIKVVAVNAVTAAFCILTAVALSVLHLPSGH
jgi:hypothetical protein